MGRLAVRNGVAAISILLLAAAGRAADCDRNGRDDLEEVASGTAADCNGNDIPDTEDIATRASADCNANGIPDECDSAPFVRGDVSSDARVNVSDPIFLLEYLFRSGRPLGCRDAADANQDAQIDLTDAIYLLAYLFRGGEALTLDCQLDEDPPGSPGHLGCEEDIGCS